MGNLDIAVLIMPKKFDKIGNGYQLIKLFSLSLMLNREKYVASMLFTGEPNSRG
jgi:hypothetical protein